MPTDHPANAVECQACGTWVERAPLCSWCTIDMRTGSWQRSDPQLAARALRRMPPSKYEAEPTACREAKGTPAGHGRHWRAGEPACDDCIHAMNANRRALTAAARGEAA